MAEVLGYQAKLYRQTTGTRATWPDAGAAPNLSEITNVRDLTLNLEAGEADVTTRGNNGWRAVTPTLFDASVEWEMVWDTADEHFAAVQAAFFGRNTIALAIMSGSASAEETQGLWADFKIFSFSRSEALEEALAVSVTAKPTYSAVAPEWVDVTAS